MREGLSLLEYDRRYYRGKVCAVTGGASGIGLALCEELLACGAAGVVLADFNSAHLAAEAERLGALYPGRVHAVLGDVTREDDVRRMIGEAVEFGGSRLDLLINCAGGASVSMFAEAREDMLPVQSKWRKIATNEDWKAGFALNYYGPLYGCRYALPVMLRQGGGQICNIISGIAFSPMAYQSIHAATKAALNAMTLTLRAEYAPYGIMINSATPGATATPLLLDAGGAPASAQPASASAQRILNGVAKNDRLILGDDADYQGARHCFLPDVVADRHDKIYLGFARMLRCGTFDVQKGLASADEPRMTPICELIDSAGNDPEEVDRRIKAYFAGRGADQVPEAYYAGKTACVTGGASGVGLALCEALLRCGAEKVVLADFNRENLKAHEERLKTLYPGKVLGLIVNVADEFQVRAMIESASAFFDGPFDLLINCAGIGQAGQFTELPDNRPDDPPWAAVEPPERWDQVFSVNFYGALYGCRAALPVMLRQGFGQIINIISGTAFSGLPWQSIYASSKAALNALTLVLRYEYWEQGIKFNSATPGTTATAIFGGRDIPEGAQSPAVSANCILTGAARNERLTLGDDIDAITAWLWGNADAARDMDELFIGMGKANRVGSALKYSRQSLQEELR